MKQTDFASAVGVVATMTLIFLLSYVFNLGASPFFLLLLAMASFGYLLLLLRKMKNASRTRRLLYLLIGSFFIMIAIIFALGYPHDHTLFF